MLSLGLDILLLLSLSGYHDNVSVAVVEAEKKIGGAVGK